MTETIILIVIVIVIIILFTIIINGNAGVYSWYGMVSRYERVNSWTISASTVNGNGRRLIKFSSEGLNALHVENKNSGGTVAIKLTQGNTEKTVDVTGVFDEFIDMSDFKPGRIQILVIFQKADEVEIKISW